MRFKFKVSSVGNPDFVSTPIESDTIEGAQEILSRTYKSPQFTLTPVFEPVFYRVGGCVRDEIIGKQPKDVDYAVECYSFEDMSKAILARGGRIFKMNPEHFSIRAQVPKLGACDYTLTRKEGPYSDGRHPDWVKVGTIYDDLARRDFRMNAIAQREDGTLIDPHNGMEDIKNRKIQCVGDAHQRITEDKLRAFRAVRFAVTMGFSIDPHITSAIAGLQIKDFDSVSSERIYEEMDKMFSYDTHFTIMQLMMVGNWILWSVAMKRGIRLFPTLKKP